MNNQKNTKEIDFFSRGLKNYNDGNYIDAIIDFNYASIYYPDYGRIYYYRGCAKTEINELEAASLDFDCAIKLFHSYQYSANDIYWAHYSLAEVFVKLGNYDKAISNYSLALERAGYFHKGGDDYNLYSTRGMLYFKQNKYGLAAANFLKVIMLEKDRLSNLDLIKSRNEYNHLYLDISGLNFRGWTEALINKYLSKQDEETYIEHFMNHNSKRLYYLGRVEEIEKNPDFHQDLLKSIKRRKNNLEPFLTNRNRLKGEVGKFLSGISKSDIEAIFGETATKMFEHLRQTGHLSPFSE